MTESEVGASGAAERFVGPTIQLKKTRITVSPTNKRKRFFMFSSAFPFWEGRLTFSFKALYTLGYLSIEADQLIRIKAAI